MYRGPSDTPEMATVLAKNETEGEASGSSYDTPTDEVVVAHRPMSSSLCHSCCHSDKNYCLLISIQLQQSLDDTSAGVSVPTRALTDRIIQLYLNPVIADITQIILLSNTDFLVYKGRKSKEEGMPYEEATSYLRSIIGSRDWVGFPIVIRATPLTLNKGKARIVDAHEFVRMLTMYKAQLEHTATQEALWTKMEQERALRMELRRQLQAQKELDKKLQKHRSINATPDLSPTRGRLFNDKQADVLEYFGVKPTRQSRESHSSSDLDPPSDSDNDSDTSHYATTSNQDRHCDKA